MDKETLELAEAIRDLFVENRVLELRATLDVIPIEAADSGHDCVDRALTQIAFFPSCSIPKPLNEAHQIVWRDPAPVDLLAFEENEKPSQMSTIVLQRVRRLLQCSQMVQIQLDRGDELTPFVNEIKAPATFSLGPNCS